MGGEVDGGAEAGEAAEGGGDADGAAGVGADGGEGGAFLDAGGGSAGGAAGEEGGVAGLEAVAEVGVLAGDAVGELMEVGLAGDDGSGFFELERRPMESCVAGGVVGVEARAAGGDVAREIEAVFEGDGDAVEGGALCGVQGFEGCGLREEVGGALGEVDVVAGVGVGVGEGVGGDFVRGDGGFAEGLLELLEG